VRIFYSSRALPESLCLLPADLESHLPDNLREIVAGYVANGRIQRDCENVPPRCTSKSLVRSQRSGVLHSRLLLRNREVQLYRNSKTMDLNNPASLDPFQRKSGSQGWIIHVACARWCRESPTVLFLLLFLVLDVGGVKIFQPPLS
jgi:hypothetical protein